MRYLPLLVLSQDKFGISTKTMWQLSHDKKCTRFIDVGRNSYRIHFLDITKNEAVNRIKNADLSEKSKHLCL